MNIEDFPFDSASVIKGNSLTIIKKVCRHVLKGNHKENAVSFDDSELILEVIRTYCALGVIKGIYKDQVTGYNDYDEFRIAYYRRYKGKSLLVQCTVSGNGRVNHASR